MRRESFIRLKGTVYVIFCFLLIHGHHHLHEDRQIHQPSRTEVAFWEEFTQRMERKQETITQVFSSRFIPCLWLEMRKRNPLMCQTRDSFLQKEKRDVMIERRKQDVTVKRISGILRKKEQSVFSLFFPLSIKKKGERWEESLLDSSWERSLSEEERKRTSNEYPMFSFSVLFFKRKRWEQFIHWHDMSQQQKIRTSSDSSTPSDDHYFGWSCQIASFTLLCTPDHHHSEIVYQNEKPLIDWLKRSKEYWLWESYEFRSRNTNI